VTSRVGVAILARAPIPGAAKTRLIPALGAVGAARLQRWMLQRTVAMALVADVGPVSLWCAGDPAHPDFAVCRAFGRVDLHPQAEGDLGERSGAGRPRCRGDRRRRWLCPDRHEDAGAGSIRLSARVMATRQRLAALGWRWQEADPLWDVDLPQDLDRLFAGYPDADVRDDAGEAHD
jgi:glycosyltransferase A (GT-A) superfamily protein (DUF2064 family)